MAENRYSAEHVRKRLRQHIAYSGRHECDVAKTIGMAQAQLSAVLTGRRKNPSIETIGRVLEELGLGWSALDLPRYPGLAPEK